MTYNVILHRMCQMEYLDNSIEMWVPISSTGKVFDG